MCDLNQYLNDDVISEMLSFHSNEIALKEIKDKTKMLYHNILNDVDYATEFTVGKIYLTPTFSYNEGIGFKVIKLTKCYIWIQVLDDDFEDTMKFLPKIHKKKINYNGMFSLTTGAYSKGWAVTIRPNRCFEFQKISHLNYMLSDRITLCELISNYKFGNVLWKGGKGFMELNDIE
jgi:hypothetical protein